MAEIIAKNSKDAWKLVVKRVIDRGLDYNDKKERKFRQLLNLNLIITEPENDITEPINMLSKSEKWLYPTIEEIKKFFLMNKKVPAYDYTYGQRLFNFNNNGINQIDNYVIPYLKDKQDKMTRRLFVSIWNPIEDSKQNGTEENPGLIGIWFKLVEKNKLTVTAIIRNNDVFMGFPANLYQIYTLQKYISEKTGVIPGPIIFYSLSAHVYLDHIDDAKRIVEI